MEILSNLPSVGRVCTHCTSRFTDFPSILAPTLWCTPGYTFTVDAFAMILGANLGGISFAAEMCATTVPLFKVTVQLGRYLRTNPPIWNLLLENYNMVLCIFHFPTNQPVKAQ